MIKNKAIWIFLFKYLLNNKFFILMFSFLLLISVGSNIAVSMLIGNSPLKFNQLSFIVIQLFLIITLICLFLLVFNTFSSLKSNNLQQFLLISPISREKLFFHKSFFVFVFYNIFNFLNLLIVIIASILTNNINFAYLNIILFAVGIILSLLFSPILILFAIFFKKIFFLVIAFILTLSLPASFITSRLLSVSKQNDALSYQFAINENNYVKLNVLNKNNQLEDQYIVGVKTYKNTTSKNQSENFTDSINPTNNVFKQLFLGEALNQLVIDLLPQPQFNYQEDYQLSKNSYLFNANLISTNKYKSGEPLELANFSENNLAYISFQDDDPFKMTYQEILEKLKIQIEKLALNTSLGSKYISSILSKTKDENWDEFALEELDILQAFAGKDAKWMFYVLKYQDWLAEKIAKVYDNVEDLYGKNVRSFIEFIWLEKDFAYNAIKTENILDWEFIDNNFPSIGSLNEDAKASDIDLNFFKNNLIHFNEYGPRIKTKSDGYTSLDLTALANSEKKSDQELKDALTDKAKWDSFIDNSNNEVVNLKIIYQKLLNIAPIEPIYNFAINSYDPIFIDQVLKIENKKWMDNSYISILIFLVISGLFFSFTVYWNKKMEVKYV